MTRRRFPRARRVIKWAMAITAAAWLACWGFSTQCFLKYGEIEGRFGISVSIIEGGFNVHVADIPGGIGAIKGFDGWEHETSRLRYGYGSTVWWPEYYKHPTLRSLKVPLWMPTAAFALPAAWLFWSDYRRVRPGQCPKCRYDRAGIPDSAPCPECGAKAVGA